MSIIGKEIKEMAIRKIIKIGGIDVDMKTSADTPRAYRHIFGRDIFQDMNRLNLNMKKGSLDTGNTEVLENIAYVMAKQANPDIPDINDWLEQFNTFDIFTASKDIISLWGINNKTMISPKKK